MLVHSSHGTLVINNQGEVIKEASIYHNESPLGKDFLRQINKFDLEEYKNHYNVETLPEDFDILDLGFQWGPENMYETPAYNWRERPGRPKNGRDKVLPVPTTSEKDFENLMIGQE